MMILRNINTLFPEQIYFVVENEFMEIQILSMELGSKHVEKNGGLENKRRNGRLDENKYLQGKSYGNGKDKN